MKDTLTAILIYLFLIASVVTSPTAQGGGRFSRASTYDQPSNVTGRAFNRFVQIWLENASFQVRFSLPQRSNSSNIQSECVSEQ